VVLGRVFSNADVLRCAVADRVIFQFFRSTDDGRLRVIVGGSGPDHRRTHRVDGRPALPPPAAAAPGIPGTRRHPRRNARIDDDGDVDRALGVGDGGLVSPVPRPHALSAASPRHRRIRR